MKVLLFLFTALFVGSCTVKSVRVEREPLTRKEIVYYAPVKGAIREEGRGYFITARCGSFFRAVEGGKVAYSGKDLDNYGWIIIIEQEDGNVGVYGKVGRPWVNQGERVKRRQVLGKVGKSKGKCGIYFEVRNDAGQPVSITLR